jgi:hypothetical protein
MSRAVVVLALLTMRGRALEVLPLWSLLPL